MTAKKWDMEYSHSLVRQYLILLVELMDETGYAELSRLRKENVVHSGCHLCLSGLSCGDGSSIYWFKSEEPI